MAIGRTALTAAMVVASVAPLAGCERETVPRRGAPTVVVERDAPSVVAGGEAERGRRALERYGCGACHSIPGVRRARGIVGPSLAGLASRPYIAGRLPNNTANLVAWIRSPRAIDPQTIMPDLAVSDADARDIAAFLAERPS